MTRNLALCFVKGTFVEIKKNHKLISIYQLILYISIFFAVLETNLVMVGIDHHVDRLHMEVSNSYSFT